jgi:hypothetical protein
MISISLDYRRSPSSRQAQGEVGDDAGGRSRVARPQGRSVEGHSSLSAGWPRCPREAIVPADHARQCERRLRIRYELPGPLSLTGARRLDWPRDGGPPATGGGRGARPRGRDDTNNTTGPVADDTIGGARPLLPPHPPHRRVRCIPSPTMRSRCQTDLM